MVNKNVCNDCWRWKSFKKDCQFHWEEKRECSKWMEHELDEDKYKSIIDNSHLL